MPNQRSRILVFAVPLLFVAACHSLHRDEWHTTSDTLSELPAEPRISHDKSLHGVACDLDHLEKHIDWYGSVTAKIPDVWGQARLTLYREQFEAQMVNDLGNFRETLQGTTNRSDQAYAQSAAALSMAVSGRYATNTIYPGTYGTLTSGLPSATPTVITKPTQVLVNGGNVPAAAPLPTVTTTTSADGKSSTQTVNNVEFFTPGGFSADNFSSNLVDKDSKKLLISIEPTEYLAQKKRYLDYLAQIRRNNEGDDTADAPGYSLNLVRIPVSVLPGTRTDKGHGAEISMTLTPVLDDNLLPNTFRMLVINDMLHQLGLPIVQTMNEPAARISFQQLLEDEAILELKLLTQYDDYKEATETTLLDEVKLKINKLKAEKIRNLKFGSLYHEFNAIPMSAGPPRTPTPAAVVPASVQPSLDNPGITTLPPIEILRDDFLLDFVPKTPARNRVDYERDIKKALTKATVSFTARTDSKVGVPTSQLVDVYGIEYTLVIAHGIKLAFENSFKRQKYAHLPDIEAYLQEEINAAYDLLSAGTNQDVWTEYCNQDLVQRIRSRDAEWLAQRQRQFRSRMRVLTNSKPTNPLNSEPMELSRTAAFAWAIIVDAALLNDKLAADMRAHHATTADGCVWPLLFIPNPPADARQGFAQYVQAKWPIHVFALDPEVQEQNLADRYQSRRELQLAASMAFISGRMNVNQLNRFARRLEAEYETIELNRTQIGFGHGPNTFGWRFYPRYQTPDTPSNLTLFARDMLIGGPSREALMHRRRLEPGPRECVAMVIVPSFVQNVRLNTTSNFFALNSPKHKVLDHTQALKLSKTVKAITSDGTGATDLGKYQAGDLEHLQVRATQLANRLPMQAMNIPMPTEQLGGFELLATGTKSLAPELHGWYGAPGVDVRGTTLFLVGDHFSPLRTHVVVGNKYIKPKMLSRQVMQVDVPADLVRLDGDNRNRVSIHVATPYGVTPELLIPVVETEKVTPEGYYLTANSTPLKVQYKQTGTPTTGFKVEVVKAAPISIRGIFAKGTLPSPVVVTFDFGNGNTVDSDPIALEAQKIDYVLSEAVTKKVLEALFLKLFPVTNTEPTPADYAKLPVAARLIVTPTPPAGSVGVKTPVNGGLAIELEKLLK